MERFMNGKKKETARLGLLVAGEVRRHRLCESQNLVVMIKKERGKEKQKAKNKSQQAKAARKKERGVTMEQLPGECLTCSPIFLAHLQCQS